MLSIIVLKFNMEFELSVKMPLEIDSNRNSADLFYTKVSENSYK